MKAISYARYDGPEVLECGELPDPKIGPDAVLVDVGAAAVNPVDWTCREGRLDGMLDAVFPVVPGWAVSGVVVQPGVSVTEFTAGDEVVGYVREDFVSRGTFAEYVAAPARTLARKPRNVSFEKAAGRPLEGRPPQGVDAVLDTVGGEALKVSANLPAPEGRLASIADGVVDHGRCCWVCPGAEDLFRLTGLVEEGAPSVHASETFPPERAVDAHRLSQEGRTRGGPW